MVGDEEDVGGDPLPPPGVSDDVAGGSDAVAAHATAAEGEEEEEGVSAPATASALPVRAWATRTGGAPMHPIGQILPAPMRDGDVVAIRAMSAVVDTVAPGDFEAAVGGMDALGHTTIMQ